MSATAIFLKIQYRLGRVNTQQIEALVGKKLTRQEADTIVGGAV